jgi:hypothetical protein
VPYVHRSYLKGDGTEYWSTCVKLHHVAVKTRLRCFFPCCCVCGEHGLVSCMDRAQGSRLLAVGQQQQPQRPLPFPITRAVTRRDSLPHQPHRACPQPGIISSTVSSPVCLRAYPQRHAACYGRSGRPLRRAGFGPPTRALQPFCHCFWIRGASCCQNGGIL